MILDIIRSLFGLPYIPFCLASADFQRELEECGCCYDFQPCDIHPMADGLVPFSSSVQFIVDNGGFSDEDTLFPEDWAFGDLSRAFAYWNMLPQQVQDSAIYFWLNADPTLWVRDEATAVYFVEMASICHGYRDSEDATFGADDISLM
jgi:hypothetical protein